jgi:NADH dehydrogenase
LVAGTADATVEYGDVLGDGIRLVVDTATRIDAATRSVQLASGDALRYDYLIYAVGSTGAVPASAPGAAEFAFPVAEFEQAQRLRAAVDELHPDAPVTVVGGGLTGIEVATELAEQGRRVVLVCGGRLGPSLSEPGRRFVAKKLAKLRIAVLESDVVTEVRPEGVVFADGAVRPSALTVWAAGFGVPDLATVSGLSTDPMGRLLTDETLTSVDDPRIIAAGDCAAPSGEPLRMCCASASQLGPQAANTVLSRIAGDEPAVFEYGLPGTCTSLGRRAAIVQFGRQDDTPVDVYLGGRIAAPLKELIVKGTVWGLRREARKPGSAFWFKGGPRPEVEAVTAP